MAIRTVSTFPLRSDGLTQDEYSTAVEASLTDLPLAITDFNAAASAFQLSVTGTSTSSVAIGTGAKSFTTQTGLGFVVGMTLRLAFDSTNYMTGDVTSYTTGTGALVMNITSVVGSGTRTSWTISLAATGANTATGVSFTPAGNIAATNVQTAIQELDTEKLSSSAGAVVTANLENVGTAQTVGTAYVIPVVTTDAKGRVSSMTTAQKITSGTAINTTSGTSHEFTSIPSGVKKIRLMFSGVSTNSTSLLMVQLGSTTYTTTGYSGGCSSSSAAVANSAGFVIINNYGASSAVSGVVEINLLTGNTYVESGITSPNGANTLSLSSGSIALAGVMDRIKLTTVNGTDTFDAGSINILME